MQALWWWSKTETCRSDIYVYINVNFNVFFKSKIAFVGEWNLQLSLGFIYAYGRKTAEFWTTQFVYTFITTQLQNFVKNWVCMAPLRAEVHLHAFLTLAQMERRAKNLRPGRLNATDRAPGTHSVGGLEIPQTVWIM